MTLAPALDLPNRIARPALSIGLQWTFGILTAVILAGSFVLTGSLITFALFLGAALVLAICLSPTASIFSIIIINVALAIRGKDSTTTATSGLDIAVGVMLVAILGYWFIRIRLVERSPLSTTVGQLSLSLFAAWSIFVTAIGLLQPHSSLNDAVRELLNLSPLLILPVLYSRYVPSGSKAEKGIFITILISGLTMIVWSFFQMKSNIARAYYLFQIGRGSTDQPLGLLLALLGTSMLMSVRGFWKTVAAVLFLLIGLIGVAISLGRTLYIAAVVCMILVLCMGTRTEFWRGVRGLCLALTTILIGLIPLYNSSHLFRLLVLNYGERFLSSRHLSTDLSLVNRYVEWRYEWQAILHSPILGRGFGRQFRVYNIIEQFHSWLGFSHSSYLYILNKTGFIGFFLFFGGFISFIVKGFGLLRRSYSSQTRELLRPLVAFLIVILIDCYAAPTLDSKTDLIWVGLIWGYFLALERSQAKETSEVPIASRVPLPALLGGEA